MACNLYSIDIWIQFHNLFHSLALSKWMLHNCSSSFCFFMYRNFSSWFDLYLMVVFFVFYFVYYYHSLLC
jgi:hypothetical protein